MEGINATHSVLHDVLSPITSSPIESLQYHDAFSRKLYCHAVNDRYSVVVVAEKELTAVKHALLRHSSFIGAMNTMVVIIIDLRNVGCKQSTKRFHHI